TPRIAYELTLINNDSLQPAGGEDRLLAFATGGQQIAQPAMLKPYDIAASDGVIVVTDSLLNVAHVFDVRRKKMFPIGWRKEGKLNKPLGVAMDGAQNIYIVDAGRGAVVKYDRQGLYLATYGHRSDFSRISDVAVSQAGDRIYILDRGGVESSSHRVTLYDGSGVKQKVIGRRGHKAGEFNHPTQLALGKNGKIYVLDSGNFRVQVFDAQGNYERHWGRPGNKTGNFARPRGIAVDDLNRVFVTDSAFQNFQIFNDVGQLLLSVGDGGGQNLPGRYMLPAGIAVDETQRVYVVDQIRRKVEVYRMLQAGDVTAGSKTE
ncbi:MAG: 6-bladed beta-propeller, partial [Gammaproteobacteria bacterium]|nr:6-bladed beta-propeller [Gammaproteobacteria bacterium]